MDRNNRPFAGLFGFKMRVNKKFLLRLPNCFLMCLDSDKKILHLCSHNRNEFSVTRSNVLRKGSLQTKLNAGLLEQQQKDLFRSERSFHEVKL